MFYGYENTFQSIEQLEQAIVDYIDYYNNKCIKVKLKGLSPVQYYSYDIKVYKLTNYVIAKEGFKEVPVEDFLEKYNISKGYIKAVSDKLLDSVLTDWKNFSGSPYSKDNMGTITIEKDEILR